MSVMNPIDKAQEAYASQRSQKEAAKEKVQQAAKDDRLAKLVLESAKAQIKHRAIHEPKVEVKNFPSIATREDAKAIEEALKKIAKELKPERDDYTPIIQALGQLKAVVDLIPKENPEMPEAPETVTLSNISEFKSYIEPLANEISKIDWKPKFDPKISVQPANVSVDLAPVVDAIEALSTAFKVVEQKEYPVTDLTPLIDATESVQKSINDLVFPVANYILPFKDSSGKATQANIDNYGNVSTASKWGIARIDPTTIEPYYYGFEDNDGNWYILRETESTGLWEYTAPSTGGVVTGWAGRAGLTYADKGVAF